jgi:hypothetical protein
MTEFEQEVRTLLVPMLQRPLTPDEQALLDAALELLTLAEPAITTD